VFGYSAKTITTSAMTDLWRAMMSGRAVTTLRALEGRTVGVALSDGGRIDECQLVSLPLRGLSTFWVFVGGEDVFLSTDSVVDIWQI
jgi:hypothetical protein